MKIKKPRGYWTLERCIKLIQSCETIFAFKYKYIDAYNAIKRNKWYYILDDSFPERRKYSGYWSKEHCRNEALKYNYRSDFQKNSGGAYQIARKNGWLNDISKHMKKKGHRYKKCVYVYEFSDNCAYIGITYDIERRIRDRKKNKNDSVTNHILNTNLIPQLKILIDYVSVDVAIEKENYYFLKYKNNGWKMLNKTKTGSIGSVKKWTKELCIIEANKYTKRGDFLKFSGGAYDAMRRYCWTDEVLLNIPLKTKPNNYWTKDKCKEVFLMCSSKKEVKLNSSTAYSVAYKNGWINEFNKYMTNGRKSNGYWTKKKCLEIALKYTKRVDFQKKNGSAYNIAYKNGWLSDIYFIVGI